MWQQLVAQDLPPPSASDYRQDSAGLLRWQFLPPPLHVLGVRDKGDEGDKGDKDPVPLQWLSGAECHRLRMRVAVTCPPLRLSSGSQDRTPASSPLPWCSWSRYPRHVLKKRLSLSDDKEEVLKDVQGPLGLGGCLCVVCNSHGPIIQCQPSVPGIAGGGFPSILYTWHRAEAPASSATFDLKRLAGAQPEDVSLISAA